MPTILLLPGILALLFAFGIAPVLMLYGRPDGALRPVLALFFGLTSAVISFYALLATELPGHQLGTVLLVLLPALSACVLVRRRFTMGELRAASVPLALSLFAVGVVCWPLIVAGWQAYIGVGNPDAAYFAGFLRMFGDHAIEMPRTPVNDYWRGIDPGGFSGMFGVAYAASSLFGVPAGAMFATMCAIAVAFLPLSLWLLCRHGLGVDARGSAIVSALGCFSSLIALAFHLQSLGTLLAATLTPAVLALALVWLRTARWQDALACGCVGAAIWYCYPQGTPFTAFVLAGAVAGDTIERRRIRWRTLLTMFSVAGAAVLLGWVPYTISAIHTVISYAGSREVLDELQMTFAPTLTERGLPFVLGLANPMRNTPAYLGGDDIGTSLLAGIAIVMCAVLVLLVWRTRSGFSIAFSAAVLGGAAFLLIWWVRFTPYGVFKAAQWLHPLIAVVVILPAVSLRPARFGRIAAVFIACVFAGLNAADGLRGGWESLPDVPGAMDNVGALTLQDFRELERLPPAGPVAIAGADRALMYWMRAFLGPPANPMQRGHMRLSSYHSWHRDYSMLTDDPSFAIHDSTPVDMPRACLDSRGLDLGGRPAVDCAAMPPKAVVAPRDPNRDIATLSGNAIWSGRKFALLTGVRDSIMAGRGWYRPEGNPRATSWDRGPFRWLRKRGELLVLFPSGEPHVLRVAAAAGYGNASPERNIALFLNGREIDQLRVSAFGVAVSKPFVAPGPVSQLELLIREDAKAVPRGRGWWHSWVPRDPRALNLAVTSVQWLPADAVHDAPTSLRFDDATTYGSADIDGVFADGWMGREARFMLQRQTGSVLQVRGFLPRELPVPARLEVSADGVAQPPLIVRTAGSFSVSFRLRDVPQSPGPVELVIRAPGARRLSAADPRQLSVRLLEIGYKTENASR